MKLGEVIRKYRKEHKMTQEEMANCLGVTAPAVNKWENGNSYPDISLLAPIARLFEISTDTLLSYREELTEQEVVRIIRDIQEKIRTESYETVFAWAMKKVQEYPNCDSLAFLTAQTLDSLCEIVNVPEPGVYEKTIRRLYENTLKSRRPELVQSALQMLFYKCLQHEEFDQAQLYLDQVPKAAVRPERMQAALYQRKNQIPKACEVYEKMLLSGYGDTVWGLQGLYELAVKEEDIKKAGRMAERIVKLAELLEQGEYQKAAPFLDLAIRKKDKKACLEILERLAGSLKETVYRQDSELYSHMGFRENAGASSLAFMLKKGLEEDDSIVFLKEDARFQGILKQLETYLKPQ